MFEQMKEMMDNVKKSVDQAANYVTEKVQEVSTTVQREVDRAVDTGMGMVDPYYIRPCKGKLLHMTEDAIREARLFPKKEKPAQEAATATTEEEVSVPNTKAADDKVAATETKAKPEAKATKDEPIFGAVDLSDAAIDAFVAEYNAAPSVETPATSTGSATDPVQEVVPEEVQK